MVTGPEQSYAQVSTNFSNPKLDALSKDVKEMMPTLSSVATYKSGSFADLEKKVLAFNAPTPLPRDDEKEGKKTVQIKGEKPSEDVALSEEEHIQTLVAQPPQSFEAQLEDEDDYSDDAEVILIIPSSSEVVSTAPSIIITEDDDDKEEE
ncbi:hypothetical protein L6452_06853 [Arctium lappa]|uniref:Uncharacterized protein n=1 Tax=Arctium lappa TaxID=4217 RepID=A0ACB9EKK4_ARCLA|nr:hypothetical protein L6452_06853 [Arctium lappa]